MKHITSSNMSARLRPAWTPRKRGAHMKGVMHTDLIINTELLTEEYGEWPSFHDSEILSVSMCLADYQGLGRRARLNIDVNVYLVKQINEGTVDFEIVKEKENVVTFEFNNVEELSLNDFHYQNIIDDICFEKAQNRISVIFVANIGADIRFKCTEAIVLNMISRETYDA